MTIDRHLKHVKTVSPIAFASTAIVISIVAGGVLQTSVASSKSSDSKTHVPASNSQPIIDTPFSSVIPMSEIKHDAQLTINGETQSIPTDGMIVTNETTAHDGSSSVSITVTNNNHQQANNVSNSSSSNTVITTSSNMLISTNERDSP